jgi:hypothetical protein
MSQTPNEYVTTELEIASFLKAAGQMLTSTLPRGRLVEFHFPQEALEHVDAYFSGAQLPARDLFEAHRSLRALIQQVKERQTQADRNGYYGNTQNSQR